MYADRYGPKPINRGSLTLSTSIVGGLVATAMLSPTIIEHVAPEKVLKGYIVPPPSPPPPPVAQRQLPKANPLETHVVRPEPIVPTVPTEATFTTVREPGPPPPMEMGTGEVIAPVIDPPKPPPVLTGAEPDARVDFQPIYPGEERRAGREGVVTLRVLIGVDGRVRQVERVTAASDAFWRATEQRALGKWRFRPATRDGVPYEIWKTMTVRFRLEEG